jgi:hypothetical protein
MPCTIYYLPSTQIYADQSSGAPAKSIRKKKRPLHLSWNATSEGNRAAPYPCRRKHLTPTNLVNLHEGMVDETTSAE